VLEIITTGAGNNDATRTDLSARNDNVFAGAVSARLEVEQNSGKRKKRKVLSLDKRIAEKPLAV